jgi:hypothetical protein
LVLRVDVEEELSSKECPRPRIGNGGHGELFVMQEVMISKDFSYLWSGSWESAGFVLLRFFEICNFFFFKLKNPTRDRIMNQENQMSSIHLFKSEP